MTTRLTTSFREMFASATVLRARELVEKGVPEWRILQAVRSGELTRVSRGMYSLPGASITERHAFVLVARRAPQSVTCLLSALRFHDLTTQNPHEVWIAVTIDSRKPRISHPPVRVVRFSPEHFHLGLEEHQVEGATVRVYSVARTVVDLFRYRNKVGIDVAIEALKEGWKERRFTMRELNHIANQLRMGTIMRPYLESLVS